MGRALISYRGDTVRAAGRGRARSGRRLAPVLAILLALSGVGVVASQALVEVRVHDAARGELSPGTFAPDPNTLATALASEQPSELIFALERGERVACHGCFGRVRELAMGDEPAVARAAVRWLAHQPLGARAAGRYFANELQTGAEATTRARAARAIGEFHDEEGLDVLETAATGDAEVVVRAAAVEALARLDHPDGLDTIVLAMSDVDAEVRLAALRGVHVVSLFSDASAYAAADVALDDADARVRAEAALVLGAGGVESRRARPEARLGGVSAEVRRASAWALLRLGPASSRVALEAAYAAENDARVRDALALTLL